MPRKILRSTDRTNYYSHDAPEAPRETHFKFLSIEERCQLVRTIDTLETQNSALVEELLSRYALTGSKYKQFRKGMEVYLHQPESTVQKKVDSNGSSAAVDPERVARAAQRKADLVARAKALKDVDMSYIDNDEFHKRMQEKTRERMIGPAPENPNARKPNKAPAGTPPYLASLYRTPLLSPEEERHLFRKMNYLKFLASGIRDDLYTPAPNAEDLEEMERHYQEAKNVEQHLTQSNLRLVVSVVRRFNPRDDHDFHNLVQEGNLVLMRAVNKFDYGRGFRFSTYATWSIRRELSRIQQRGHKRSQRENPSQDVVEYSVSADGFISEGEERHIQARQEATRDILFTLIDCLDEREQHIVKNRVGINESRETQTLEAIGGQLGITKERVRQIYFRALKKMRDISSARGYTDLEFPS